MTRLGERANVEVAVSKIIKDDQGRMSSSRIRSTLRAGDLKKTNILLGREYSFCGSVVPGKGLGRGIGWPTANLQVNAKKLLPGPGVYAAFAKEINDPENEAEMSTESALKMLSSIVDIYP